ncbi:MAG: phage holin family protein [Thiobacillus sp.]|nr:phage holin family protein [Thiobacillus sp.]
MSEPVPGAGKGLLDSLTLLAATLVAIAHTRLDLLSSDLEEEREHVFALVASALVALFCLGVGVVLAAILVAVAFWDGYRLPALAGLAGFFLVAGLSAWAYARRQAGTKPRLFAASLSELAKARQHLVARS